MRILWFSSIFPAGLESLPQSVGGGWIGASLSAIRQFDPQSKFCILCLGDPRIDIDVDGCRVVGLGFAKKSYSQRIPSRLVERIASIIKGFAPDIIHINGTEFYYGTLPRSAYCGVPTIVSLQGVISGLYPHFTGALTPAEMRWHGMNLRFLKTGATIFSEQTYWRTSRSEQESRIFCGHYNFIGRTAFDRAHVLAQNGEARYFHVDEILRPAFYSVRREAQNVVRHSIFCGAAAGYPLKGAHWLIRAVAILKKRYPDVTLHIAAAERLMPRRSLMCRLKDDGYSSYLRKLIRQLGVSDSIRPLPSLSAEEVARELQRAAVFALPSLCENSPNSLCEAMMVGTPAVATYTGGIPSILRDGEEGLLVPICDPVSLAAAISNCFDDPESAEYRAANARRRALERHSPEKNAAALYAAYAQVVAQDEHAHSKG